MSRHLVRKHSPSPTEVAADAGISRRRLLGLGAGIGAGAGLTALLGPPPASATRSFGPLATSAIGSVDFASMWSDEAPRTVMEQIIADYVATGAEVNMSTTPIEDYKTQIRAFLQADNPPDVLTWFAGERARFFVERELILDISDLYSGDGAAAGYADSFKALSTTGDRQYFLPSQWYWWGVWYRPSLFEENGYTVPESWDDFVGLLEAMQADGLDPISIGTRTTPWTTGGWFDYLNLRINGYDFHVALLAGEESYTDERVRAVFDAWAEVLPYFTPNSGSYAWQEAVTPLVDKTSGLYLMGRFLTDALPADAQDDIDFFRFPTIDESVGTAEEAPVDGYFASANTDNVDGAIALLNYLASPDAQTLWVTEYGQVAANPDVPTDLYSPLVQKGVDLIRSTENVAQFYDRDTNPEMATIGLDGFVEFIAEPDRIDDILGRLQTEAERIFAAE